MARVTLAAALAATRADAVGARCSVAGICSGEGSSDIVRGQMGGMNASSHGAVEGEHRFAHCRIQMDLFREPRSSSADPVANGQGHPCEDSGR